MGSHVATDNLCQDSTVACCLQPRPCLFVDHCIVALSTVPQEGSVGTMKVLGWKVYGKVYHLRALSGRLGGKELSSTHRPLNILYLSVHLDTDDTNQIVL